ncbi:MAG: replication initiation factor domain-containing protein [Rhizobacter sp.]|nr:replication initiation factor domain-containing protein [Rhizobacter sp.]
MKAHHRVSEKPILSGNKVKWTLEQVRADSQENVRLDWLRFTVPLDAVLRPEVLPPLDPAHMATLSRSEREKIAMTRAVDGSECMNSPVGASRHGAQIVAELLGLFEPDHDVERGMDFYEVRCALRHEGAIVGHVLAGGQSQAQASTVHVNLFGSACLHIRPKQWAKLRRWLAEVGGWITRVDLALDVFEGHHIQAVRTAWLDGEFDVRGKRPSQTEHGSWTAGHSRTFQVGQRQTGKVFRAYEKGDEQFGPEHNDPWIRYEVEFRSSSRIVDLDTLIRPADFFAGAYPFLERIAAECQTDAEPQRIPTFRKLQDATALAAATRGVRWLARTAGPMLARVFFDGGDLIASIVTDQGHRTPARFVGFARETVREALEKVAAGMTPSGAPSLQGG